MNKEERGALDTNYNVEGWLKRNIHNDNEESGIGLTD